MVLDSFLGHSALLGVLRCHGREGESKIQSEWTAQKTWLVSRFLERTKYHSPVFTVSGIGYVIFGVSITVASVRRDEASLSEFLED